MICIENLSKSFGEKLVLDSFSACFKEQGVTCIMGESGGGKTTLLNLILGLIKPDSGRITGLTERLSAVFQEDRLCEPYSAVRNILAVTGKRVAEEEIVALLRKLRLEGSEYVPVNTLSGGMRRRVALARALLAEHDLLVLDEPFKGLDDETRTQVIDLLKRYSVGKTLIIATHDPRDAFDLSADIIEI